MTLIFVFSVIAGYFLVLWLSSHFTSVKGINSTFLPPIDHRIGMVNVWHGGGFTLWGRFYFGLEVHENTAWLPTICCVYYGGLFGYSFDAKVRK